MDPAGIVEDTEWSRFCPQIDRLMDGWMDKVKPVYPLQLARSSGYNNSSSDCYLIPLFNSTNSIKPTDNANPIVMALICHNITMI